MYKKVLFPTDFSSYSQKVTGCIGEIPGIKEVVLLHIVDATSSLKTETGLPTEIEHARCLMEEQEKTIGGFGVTVQTDLEITEHTGHQGTIGFRILEKAKKESVSLIIMGARGKSLKDLFLGSVSTYLLYHAAIPLLLVKSPPSEGMSDPTALSPSMPIFSKVLIPTDFSDSAGDVLRLVKDIREIDEIILLHVIHAGKNDFGLQESTSRSKKNLGIIKEELVRSGFTVKDIVRVGYPPDEINFIAGQEQVTLIAMSPLGEGWRRGLKELFVGSTTYAVVRRATLPVLVVRPLQKS